MRRDGEWWLDDPPVNTNSEEARPAIPRWLYGCGFLAAGIAGAAFLVDGSTNNPVSGLGWSVAAVVFILDGVMRLVRWRRTSASSVQAERDV